MKSFLKIAEKTDVLPLVLELQRNPQLWDQNTERRYAPDTPHGAMSDIWVRYNDRRPFDAGQRPMSEINDEHHSVWYPAAGHLPAVKSYAMDLMARVRGESLGGILITRLAPGAELDGHVDTGWHAGFYDKYYVALHNAPESVFWFNPEPPGERERLHARTGDVHWFRNDIVHGVQNLSSEDRLAMIVCIRHDKPWQ